VPVVVRCRGCGDVGRTTLCGKCKAERSTARAARRGRTFYHSPEWRALSRACIERDGACLVCGSRERMVAHHVENRNAGGADDLGNLITLCGSHHSKYEALLRAGQFQSELVLRVAEIGRVIRTLHGRT
jgi:hypothetical protein